jgi:hypothetical protein
MEPYVSTDSCWGVFSPLDLALGWKNAKNRVKNTTLWCLSKVFNAREHCAKTRVRLGGRDPCTPDRWLMAISGP